MSTTPLSTASLGETSVNTVPLSHSTGETSSVNPALGNLPLEESVLVGERIYLTQITPEDTDDIVRWRNSPFVRENFIYRETFTPETHERWLKTMVETGRVVQFVMRLRSTGAAFGSVYLRDLDRQNHKCEFGIFIGEQEMLSQGYGREAAQLITDYAFQCLGMHKVFLRVLAENLRARQSYRKAGFQEEGTARDDVWIDGHPADVVFMAMIQDET